MQICVKKQVRGQLVHVVEKAVSLQLFTVAKKNAVNISLHPVELEKALDLRDFYKSVITISLNGKSEKVVCKDVQFDPVSDMPIHVDFMRN